MSEGVKGSGFKVRLFLKVWLIVNNGLNFPFSSISVVPSFDSLCRRYNQKIIFKVENYTQVVNYLCVNIG